MTVRTSPSASTSESSGWTNRQLASALAGFTQLVGRDYRRNNWPFEVVFPDENGGLAVYRIPQDLLATWREALDGGDAHG